MVVGNSEARFSRDELQFHYLTDLKVEVSNIRPDIIMMSLQMHKMESFRFSSI